MVSIRVHFDGKTLIPEEKLDLPQGRSMTAYIVTGEQPDPSAAIPPTIWGKLMALAGQVEGLPADASEHHDRYLYDQPHHD